MPWLPLLQVSVQLVAHSMGNQGLVLALKDLQLADSERRHHSLVFTAPDVSRDDFQDVVNDIKFDGIAALYCNDFDWALKVSSFQRGLWFGRASRRAGECQPFPLVLSNGSVPFNTVDVRYWRDWGDQGHSYMRHAAGVGEDIAHFMLRVGESVRKVVLRRCSDYNPRFGFSWLQRWLSGEQPTHDCRYYELRS